MLKTVPNHYDVIVLGVGAMGSAAVYHLAKRGRKVLGLERFDIPHVFGSSHGITRIIRLAYYEHPSYVDLLRRAYELWREIQTEAGEQLLHIIGGIDAGPADSAVVTGAWRSAKEHDLPHEVFTGPELRRRHPGFNLPAGHLAVYQPDGGFLLPERCVAGYVLAAQAHGAEVHGREAVLDWEPHFGGVKVRTLYDEYTADKLVIAAGAWADHFVPELRGLTVPERQVLGWFQPRRPEYFHPSRFPVFNMLVEEGRYYGFPQFSIPGFKVGRYHHFQEVIDPDNWEREANDADQRVLREFTNRYFPDGAGPTQTMATCIFTNTPDRHFILDLHPEFPNVVVASPCSGHGFKFASVIGEIAADLAERGQTRHDLTLFRLARFTDPDYGRRHGIEPVQTGAGHGAAPAAPPARPAGPAPLGRDPRRPVGAPSAWVSGPLGPAPDIVPFW